MKTIQTLLITGVLTITMGGVANAGPVSDRMKVRNCPLVVQDGVAKHKCSGVTLYGPVKRCPLVVQDGRVAHRCK